MIYDDIRHSSCPNLEIWEVSSGQADLSMFSCYHKAIPNSINIALKEKGAYVTKCEECGSFQLPGRGDRWEREGAISRKSFLFLQ